MAVTDGMLPDHISQVLALVVRQQDPALRPSPAEDLIVRPMLRFERAAIAISRIELAQKIKKGQFKIGKLRNRTATMSEQ
jgi:hypothetical protein